MGVRVPFDFVEDDFASAHHSHGRDPGKIFHLKGVALEEFVADLHEIAVLAGELVRRT